LIDVSAAVIKKISNNFQFSITNSFHQTDVPPQVMMSPKVSQPVSESPIPRHSSSLDPFSDVQAVDTFLSGSLSACAGDNCEKTEVLKQALQMVVDRDALWKPVLERVAQGLGEVLGDQAAWRQKALEVDLIVKQKQEEVDAW